MATIAAERELMERVAQNDGAAYKDLFILYHKKLLSFAQSILHSRELAEEVVSDVFMEVWKKRSTVGSIENVRLFLYICTRNRAINALSKNRRPHFSENALVEMHSLYYDPEQLFITSEMIRRVQKAVLELPPRCQLIFKLIKEDGLKYKEVAQLLDLSVKTVESQMTIALKKIGSTLYFNELSLFSTKK